MTQPNTADYKHDFDQYVAKATTLIHAPETTASIQQMLGGPDPVQSVATAAVMVMQRVDDAARKSGLEIQDSVRVFAADEIVKLVAELGTAAQRIPPLNDDLIQLALSVTCQDYVKGEVKAGRINPQQLAVAIQADLRKLPPKMRKEIQTSQERVMMTARRYNGGKGLQQMGPGGQPPQDQPAAPAQGGEA